MREIHPMSTNECTCDFTRLTLGRDCEVCTTNRVETLLEDVRAEIGNAGFAAAVGETALADESLLEAVRQIQAVREALRGQS